MNSIRIKFARGEEVEYISHLDLMKVFERAIRRSNIPIAYSTGFNPHPQMVFGLPLSVGVTSSCEYGDFEFSALVEPENFMKSLNNSLPEGFKILDAKNKKTKFNIMAEISEASYEILVLTNILGGQKILQERFDELLEKNVLMVLKEGKNGKKYVDIRPMIYKIYVNEFKPTDNLTVSGECYNISMLISAGSKANLKPELVIQAINNELGLELKKVKIHRTGLHITKFGKLNDPLDDDILLAT